MHTDHLQTFLQLLYKNDTTSRRTVREFGRLLKCVYSDDPKLYRSLFLKKQVCRLESVNAVATQKKIKLTDLRKAGLINYHDKSGCSSAVMVHRNVMDVEDPKLNPVDEWFIATDWPDILADDAVVGKEMVFPIHYESVYLLRKLTEEMKSAPWSEKRVLDVFCGSGILGVYAALSGAKDVIAVDINERALAFTRLNAILNGKHDVIKLSKSDIFRHMAGANLCGKQFDIILANAPFEPAPLQFHQKYFTHSYAGEYGNAILQPFFDQVDGYLAHLGKIVAVSFTCGSKEGPSGLDCGINGSTRSDACLRLGSMAKHLRELESLDSIPLDQFCLHFMPQSAGEKAQLIAWRRKLADKGFDSLHLVSMTFRKKSKHSTPAVVKAPKEENSLPCDWSVPLNWYFPCGYPSGKQTPVKVLLIDPPFHTYFPKDSVMSDQGKCLEMPLNMLCLATYLRERLPSLAEVKLLHLDYELTGNGLKEKSREKLVSDEIVVKKVLEWVEKGKPDIVGIGAFTVQAPIVSMILKAIRKHHPNVLTVGGGPHISFRYNDFFKPLTGDKPLLDFAAIGEGEYAMEDIVRSFLLLNRDRKKLLESINVGHHRVPRNTLVAGCLKARGLRTRAMDILPMDLLLLDGGNPWFTEGIQEYQGLGHRLLGGGNPREFLLKANIVIHTKRGCPHNCKFCISSRFYGRREIVRPVKDVCEEIEQLSLFGCDNVEILDEVFDPVMPSGTRPDGNEHFKLCKMLAGETFEGMRFVVQMRANMIKDATLAIMKAARISTILVGAESASDDVLRAVRKDETFEEIKQGICCAKSWGFRVGAFWIIGLPGSHPKDDAKTLEAILAMSKGLSCCIDWNEVNLFVPYPGTEYFPEDEKKNVLVNGNPKTNLFFCAINPKDYYKWQRFGHLRNENGSKGCFVQPVFSTRTYPVRKLAAMVQRFARNELVNPPEVPCGSIEIRQSALLQVSKLVDGLAKRFEKDVGENESKLGNKSDATQNADSMLEATAEKVFKDLVFSANETSFGNTLPGIALSSLAVMNRLIDDYGIEIKSLIVAPFRVSMNNHQIEPINNDTVGVAYRKAESSRPSTKDSQGFHWTVEALNKSTLFEAFNPNCKYYLTSYATYRADPHVEVKTVAHPDTGSVLVPANESCNSKLFERPEKPSMVKRSHDCSSRWLIAIGMCRIPQSEKVFREELAQEDEQRLSRQGVFMFLDAAARILMSNLANRLALKLEADNHERQLRDRVRHVIHDLRNVVAGVTLTEYLQKGVDEKIQALSERFCEDGCEKMYGELVTWLKFGNKFSDAQGNDKTFPEVLRNAANKAKTVRDIITAHYEMSKGRPDPGCLAGVPTVIEHVSQMIKDQLDQCKEMHMINKMLLNWTSDLADISLAVSSGVKFESTVKLPLSSMFDIGLKEMLRNAVKHGAPDEPIEVVISVTERKIDISCVNRCTGGSEGKGVGQSRLREIAQANNGIIFTGHLNQYFSSKQYRSKWCTKLSVNLKKYAKALARSVKAVR